MADNKKMIYPYLGTCSRCGCYNNKDGNEDPTYYRMGIGAHNIAFCPACFNDLYAEMSHALKKSPMLDSTAWVLRVYDDGEWWNWGIFPMVVKEVRPNGFLEEVDGKPSIWHIHAEDEHVSIHLNFSDIGNTLFFTEEEAKEGLKRKNEELNAKPLLPEGHPDATW